MAAVIANKEQALEERQRIIRIRRKHRDIPVQKLATMIHDHETSWSVFHPEVVIDVVGIRDAGKPFYGILHVLRTAGNCKGDNYVQAE